MLSSFAPEATSDPHPLAPSATTRPLDDIERELTTLAAHLNAGNYRFLVLLAEFARREGHAGIGIVSCAHWLSWKCGISLVAAREKVRVARALESLPKLSDAMRRGVVSYCKARAITRIATPANEGFLVGVAQAGTVTHVERLVRGYRDAERGEELKAANARYAGRSFDYFYDEDGSVVIRGRLDAEQGTLVIKALEAAGDALREQSRAPREASQAAGTEQEPATARRADALALMAETLLAGGAVPLAAGDRHLVTVHVDEEVLRDHAHDGRSEIDGGPSVPPATVRRLCCDGGLVAVVERGGGTALDVGRKTRAIPAAMRRALEARDEGCRYPGCTNERFVDGHHIEHWVHGGETKLDNLVLLCRRHHRFVHELGFHVERRGEQIRFVRPDGKCVPAVADGVASEGENGWMALARAHARLGIKIEAGTGVPHWRGERTDVNYMLAVLEQRDGRAPAALLKLTAEHGDRVAEDDWEPALQVVCE
jgi:hypothetical protein